MINQHYYKLHTHVRQGIHQAYLKPLHVKYKVSTYELCKMTKTQVDPKDFYFRQASKVSNIYQFKSYFSETSFNLLERIEERLPEEMDINNPTSASWITTHDNP